MIEPGGDRSASWQSGHITFQMTGGSSKFCLICLSWAVLVLTVFLCGLINETTVGPSCMCFSSLCIMHETWWTPHTFSVLQRSTGKRVWSLSVSPSVSRSAGFRVLACVSVGFYLWEDIITVRERERDGVFVTLLYKTPPDDEEKPLQIFISVFCGIFKCIRSFINTSAWKRILNVLSHLLKAFFI